MTTATWSTSLHDCTNDWCINWNDRGKVTKLIRHLLIYEYWQGTNADTALDYDCQHLSTTNEWNFCTMKQRFRTSCSTCHRSAAMMQHWVEMTEHDILSTLYNKPTTTPIANVIGYDVNVICGSVCTDWPCANSTKQRVLFLRAALIRITLGRRDMF